MNQRGFVTTGFLILLPLLITISALCAAAYLLFSADAAARHQCRLELLKAQSEIASDLNRLIEMNTEARQLRNLREQAEEVVLATTGTPAMALAEVNLNAVIARQTLFAIKQKALLVHAKLLSRTGPLKAQLKIRPAAERTRVRGSSPLDLSSHQQSGAFAVESSPPDSLTPDYEPAPNFTRRQEMRLSWTFSVVRFLPAWLKQYLSTEGLKANAQCSATIEKESGQWKAKLTVGK